MRWLIWSFSVFSGSLASAASSKHANIDFQFHAKRFERKIENQKSTRFGKNFWRINYSEILICKRLSWWDCLRLSVFSQTHFIPLFFSSDFPCAELLQLQIDTLKSSRDLSLYLWIFRNPCKQIINLIDDSNLQPQTPSELCYSSKMKSTNVLHNLWLLNYTWHETSLNIFLSLIYNLFVLNLHDNSRLHKVAVATFDLNCNRPS